MDEKIAILFSKILPLLWVEPKIKTIKFLKGIANFHTIMIDFDDPDFVRLGYIHVIDFNEIDNLDPKNIAEFLISKTKKEI